MPSAAAAAAAATPDGHRPHHHHSPASGDQSHEGSDIGMDNDDDDVEYEEIEEEVEVEEEVEEEVEVEEEIEEEEVEEEEEEVEEEEEMEEEVEEGEEIGEDLSDSPIDEDQNDVSQGMESKGHEEHLRSGSSDPEKSVVNLPADSLAVEGGIDNSKFSGAGETRQKGESTVNVEDPKSPNMGIHQVASKDDGLLEFVGDKKDSGDFPKMITPKDDDVCNDGKASQRDSGIMTAETTKPFNVSEIKQIGTQSQEDINQGPTRLAVPQVRPRSLSPLAGYNDGSKRPAVICDFFAKGWCIKGNSCRFLHIKDDINNICQKPEGDVATLNEKSELQADGGLRDGTERSESADFPNAAASSAARSSSFSLERTSSWEHGKSPRWHGVSEKHKILSLQREDLSRGVSPDSLQSPVYKDKARSTSSFKDVGRENLTHNWSSDDYPISRNSCFPEQRSLANNSVISSDTYRSTVIPSHATSFEDMAARRSQFMLHDRSSPGLSRSPNLSLSPSIQTAGILPSQHIPAWTRSSFSFSSLGTDSLGAPKHSDSDREYHASRSSSWLQSSLRFSGSESENLSVTNVSGGPLPISGHRTKISSNDWEPSVRFRSSFFIPQSPSSPGSLYDPIRDSIEQPNLGDGFSKLSSTHEKSVTNTHLIMDGDPALTRSLGPECGSYKHSISGHHEVHDNMLDKNFHGKNLFRTEGEAMRISHDEQKNKNTLPKEEKLLTPAYAKDITEANKINLESDLRLRKDGLRHKNELKVDNGRQSNEMDVDLKTDWEQKESKALKHFRAALIDFVKELVKPAWREGHLSKDAHKVIVKKAVDKVLSTTQPHQAPNTAESIQQYLDASQQKISKLVEGYVVKYGKS
ncbi:unnamed protein product [Camellia sinensis]|uniref:protein FRIGIDA-ESSENTIAL 1 isoform X2 n=1 Tax=Camellia sinensis TaxID=4442 RepID=UPI001035E749|nr:protein FRIGIDA-ESSENTIAL 1 isoform X2 [Camellia sinensis]